VEPEEMAVARKRPCERLSAEMDTHVKRLLEGIYRQQDDLISLLLIFRNKESKLKIQISMFKFRLYCLGFPDNVVYCVTFLRMMFISWITNIYDVSDDEIKGTGTSSVEFVREDC
jgi:hypothetical protein